MSAGAARELVDAARRAGRVHGIVRALECAAAASLAGSVVFAAGVASGASAGRDLAILAGAIALLAAALVWSEHPPRTEAVARRADRAAGLDGALTAVLDGARATRGSEIVDALAARVRSAVAPRDLVRAAWPRTPIAVAAPLLGAAIVAVALEARPPARAVGFAPGSSACSSSADPRDAEAAFREAAEALRAAAVERRGAGDGGTAERIEDAAARAEAAARGPRGSPDPAALAAEIGRLAAALPVGEPGRSALERAASELSRPDRTTAISAGRGRDPAALGAGETAPPSPSGRGAGGPGLANASGDGRMFGPPAGGESDPRSDDPASGTVANGGAGRGVASARWWPSRYDAVVERFLTP